MENGIDIPNANTIIINGAHRFGLSDLHQMRGRVGRGNRKAFCYLLAPPLADLPAESRRRLEALENFSDLGSGIHIAMQDLDIRGAGNLLGAEQSGFIADLGYETYVKILQQAVVELRNEKTQPQPLPVREGSGHSQGRKSDGETPLRRLGKSLGCEKIILKQQRMILFFVSQNDSPYYQSEAFDHILTFVAQNPRRCQFREQNGKRSMLITSVPTIQEAVQLLKQVHAEG